MVNVIKSILDKLKIKEIVGILFIACVLITFLLDNIANELKIIDFREKYQMYLTICIILTGSYYLLILIKYIWIFIVGKFINDKKTAINYMKRYMSPDDMGLLFQTFYDKNMNRFKSSGLIDLADGRRTPLESKKIIYLASQMGSTLYGFLFNMQPYALEFLNEQLQQGNIQINGDNISWQFR